MLPNIGHLYTVRLHSSKKTKKTLLLELINLTGQLRDGRELALKGRGPTMLPKEARGRAPGRTVIVAAA